MFNVLDFLPFLRKFLEFRFNKDSQLHVNIYIDQHEICPVLSGVWFICQSGDW